jgi:hypothetical protein
MKSARPQRAVTGRYVATDIPGELAVPSVKKPVHCIPDLVIFPVWGSLLAAP